MTAGGLPILFTPPPRHPKQVTRVERGPFRSAPTSVQPGPLSAVAARDSGSSPWTSQARRSWRPQVHPLFVTNVGAFIIGIGLLGPAYNTVIVAAIANAARRALACAETLVFTFAPGPCSAGIEAGTGDGRLMGEVGLQQHSSASPLTSTTAGGRGLSETSEHVDHLSATPRR